MSHVVKTTEGKEFVSESSMSILDSALGAGFIFEYSCKNGQCGVCKTTLLDGNVKEIVSQQSLTEQEKQQGIILSCCCEPVSDILIDAEDLSALHGIEIKTLPARISSIQQMSPDIVEVVLRLPPTADFNFLEGQYLDVIGPNGVRRSYSIASSSSQKEITLLIKKVEGGVLSQYWFFDARENDLVRIEGPKGTFFIRDIGEPLLFLATGTGIAPVISMLQGLDEMDGFDQKHPIQVFWGNRFKEDFVLCPEFERLNVDFVKVLSRQDGGWGSEVGYVQDVALTTVSDMSNLQVYACGSNEMIQSAKRKFFDSGLPEKNFFSDAFVQSL